MLARIGHAPRPHYGVLLAFFASITSLGQQPEVRPMPMTLTEALMRLETIDRGPTRNRQPGPIELFESIPESSHFKREQCQAAGEYSAKVGGRALLILVDDRPVYQRYEPGWARWKPHLLGSASQCLVGLAAAVAVQED